MWPLSRMSFPLENFPFRMLSIEKPAVCGGDKSLLAYILNNFLFLCFIHYYNLNANIRLFSDVLVLYICSCYKFIFKFNSSKAFFFCELHHFWALEKIFLSYLSENWEIKELHKIAIVLCFLDIYSKVLVLPSLDLFFFFKNSNQAALCLWWITWIPFKSMLTVGKLTLRWLHVRVEPWREPCVSLVPHLLHGMHLSWSIFPYALEHDSVRCLMTVLLTQVPWRRDIQVVWPRTHEPLWEAGLWRALVSPPGLCPALQVVSVL